ncbi:putative uncharacterized membrane associated phage protein [Moritella viscosa]|nr:hypothetical protein [Moritella viscosa]CED59828.1 putative uncharacterized membrane associated phage protein [Moritella viscosa]SHO03470.1 Putative uncharacterized protein [Moritella viscosa]
MSNEVPTPNKGIKKSDVFTSVTLSGFLTFILLTWSKTLESSDFLHPYITEQTISFLTGITSFLLTLLFSFIRYEVSFIVNRREYTTKLKFLDELIEIAPFQNDKIELEKQKSVLIKHAADAIVKQKR